MDCDWVYVVCPVKIFLHKIKDELKKEVMEFLENNVNTDICNNCCGYDTTCKIRDRPELDQIIRVCTRQPIKAYAHYYTTTTRSAIPDVGAWDREYKSTVHHCLYWKIIANGKSIEFTTSLISI